MGALTEVRSQNEAGQEAGQTTLAAPTFLAAPPRDGEGLTGPIYSGGPGI